MAKAKFQGYAIGKGFSNIDPGYSALTRLQEKQNQDLANLKQEEKDRRNRDIQAEADLERVMKNQEANRKDIYIEDKVFSTQERALQVNKETFVQNEKAKIKSIEAENDAFQKIIEFSQTAFEDYQKIKAKDWEATMNASYNYHMTHSISLEDQLRIDLMEDELFRQGANFEAIADQMREEGYTNEEIHYVRGKNSASDYGRLKAYSVRAGENWQAFAKSELVRMGITDKVEQQAALDALRIKYLKAHKLYGLSSDFLEPMFQKMRSSTDQMLAQTQLRNDVEFSQRRTTEALTQLHSFLSPDSLNNAFLAKTRELNPRTGDYFNKAEAKQWIFDTLANVNMFPDDEKVMNLLQNTDMLHMNKKWGDEVNQLFVNDLIDTRVKNKDAIKTQTELAVKQKKEEILVKTRDFFNDPQRWNGDKKVGDKIILELKAQGFTNDELAEFLPHLDQSVSARADGDEWRKIINDAAADNTLTSEDLHQPWVPSDLRRKYDEQARANDALFKNVNIEEVGKTLGDSLRQSLNDLSLESALHPSFRLAKAKAISNFREIYKNTGDKDAAIQAVQLQIEKGKFEKGKLGSGDFIVQPPERWSGDQSFFQRFTPGTHQYAPPVIASNTKEERDAVILQLSKNATLLDKKLFLHPEDLKEIALAIKEGRSYRIPEVVFDIFKADKKRLGSPTEVWQRQLEVAVELGLLEKHNLKVEDFRYTLFRDVDDPTAKKLIDDIRTKGDFLKVIQVTRNPQSTRDPRFMSTAVVRKINQPSVLEAQLRREEMRDDPYYEYDVETGTYSQYGVE